MLRAKKITTEHRQTANVVDALNLIWSNLEKPLDLEILSSACNVSKYHFHRIFLEHQGETLSSYISRKRLERAANHLVLYPYYSISQIASSSGYSSHANFSKAFKRHFGISAREYRHPWHLDAIPEGVINSKYGKVINPNLHYSRYQFFDELAQQKRLQQLDETITLVELEEQKLIYRTVNDGMSITSWYPMWDKVIQWAEGNYEDWQNNLFGVWYDNANVCPMHSMRQDVGFRVPNSMDVQLPFMTHKIEKGSYITGIITGQDFDLLDTVRDVYMFWMVRRCLVPDFAPYYSHYLNNFLDDGYHKVQFYIKVKSKIQIDNK